MDLGFDGLIVESHCQPDDAWSDAKQQVTPEVLDYILSLLVVRDEHYSTEGLHQLRSQIDECDNQLFPRRGSEFMASLTLTPPWSLWDGKDYANLATNSNSATYREEQQEKYKWIEYHKWKFKTRTYTALTGGQKCFVLMTRIELGLLGSYNSYKKSPFETFYVGGDGMSGYSSGYAQETIGLRGYENGSLTPYSAPGYAYDRFTLELRYPFMLGNTTIYGLSFLEGGNAWYDTKKFNPFDMKRSAGVGVRIFLPMVGLMGIDWAYGFDKALSTGTKGGSQFHFVLGQEF